MSLLLAMLLTPGVAAVPPPVEQATADCKAPVYASDHLVCSDPALLALDGRLAARVAASPAIETGSWLEGHGEWFRRRSLCAFQEAHEQCLSEAYTDRLALLENLGREQPAGRAAACRGEAYTGKLHILGNSGTGHWLLTDAASGDVLGVAAARSLFEVWVPALTVEPRGEELKFSRHDGAGFTCRYAPG